MNRFNAMILLLLVSVTVMHMPPVYADSLSQARDIESQTNAESRQSQSVIDRDFKEIEQLKAQIEQKKVALNNLTLYQQHLANLVASQNSELSSLEQQIDDIKVTKQGIVPLMYHMLFALQQMIDTDIPVRITSRYERLDELNQLMKRADVSEAEKYRRLLEAYQIEIDYGTKMGIYNDEITLKNGEVRQVSLLHLGRIVLVARSMNNQQHWFYSKQQQQWNELNVEQVFSVDKAFAIAEKKQAPELLSLPLSLPVATHWENK
ncbi:DUF3450 domain-containing protein [Aliivibrio kagoshimensis]|uniref:DUF3450 domain-containing protein n=1 Tax=Aliivibrio kagoshimensis TaxID=2910230 RepID=UPI003D117CA4